MIDFQPIKQGVEHVAQSRLMKKRTGLVGKKYKLKGESGSEKKQQLVSLKKRKKF